MTILFSLINKKIHSLSDQVNYIERTGFFFQEWDDFITITRVAKKEKVKRKKNLLHKKSKANVKSASEKFNPRIYFYYFDKG